MQANLSSDAKKISAQEKAKVSHPCGISVTAMLLHAPDDIVHDLSSSSMQAAYVSTA